MQVREAGRYRASPPSWAGFPLHAVLLAGTAVAAGSAEASMPPADDPRIDQITVTVRRREETLVTTPASITAWTEADLGTRAVTSLADIGRFTPNLSFDSTAPISGSSNASAIVIRGVGQSEFLLTQDPGVSIYLDDVYIARSVGSVLDTLDVRQIEVLRGPQGAPFGKSSIGGVVRVVTNRPETDFGGSVDLTAGNFDRRDFVGVLNVPLSDTLLSRVAVAARHRDGYVERRLVGDTLGDRESIAARLRMLWLPAESVEVDWTVEWYRGRDSSAPSAMAGDPAEIGAPSTIFGGTYNATLDFHGGPPYDQRWLTGDRFVTNATGSNRSDTDVFGTSVNVAWSLGRGMELRSTTAWREFDAHFDRDPDNTPIIATHNRNDMRHGQFSQELEISGAVLDGRLDWLAGAFFLDESGSNRILAEFIPDTFGAPADGTLWETLGLTTVPPLVIGGPETDVDNRTLSGYVSASWQFTPSLSASASTHYTRDEREVYIPLMLTQVDVQLLADPYGKRSFDYWSSKVGLQYEISERHLVYASYADGVKSGGFNQRYGAPLPAPTGFLPEKVKTVEAGLRSTFLDGRLFTAVTVFHSRYSDMQVVVFDGGIPRTINATEGEIDGAEVEVVLTPEEHWNFRLGYGYLDAGYTRLAPAVEGSFGVPIVNPLSLDDDFVDAPRHSLSAGAQYSWTLGRSGWLTLWSQFSYRSRWANDAINTPELIQNSVTLVDARLTYESPRRTFSLALFAINLTDETYLTSGVADKAGFGAVEISPAPPREWGITAGYRF